ncbi:galactokinase [bacterium]|nr:galactokinase [bacterium]
MIIARAPLRITLGGGGTDLPSYYSRFGGVVIAAAINKYVYICLNRSSTDTSIKIKYSESESVLNLESIKHPFFKEALDLFQIRDNIEIASLADIQSGTGMGSSGSFLVALVSALAAYKKQNLSAAEVAEMAFEIEAVRLGMPVGKQDPYIAALGGISLINVSTQGKVKASRLKLGNKFFEELRNSMLLFYTGLRRRSRDILLDQKEKTENADNRMLDNLHRVKELGEQMKQALFSEDIETVGRLMDEHWKNKRARTGAITNPEIDKWYATAMAKGALGGKILGAGGGGFLMLICNDLQTRKRVTDAMLEEGLHGVDYEIETEGVKLLTF